MNNINYMKVLPGGHCFYCHKDYEEMSENHPCAKLYYGNKNPTSCEPGCSKKFNIEKILHGSDVKVVEEDWEKNILSRYFVSRLYGDKSHVGAQTDLISDIKQLLQKQREEIVGEIEKNRIIRMEEHEVNGWLKGYEEC